MYYLANYNGRHHLDLLRRVHLVDVGGGALVVRVARPQVGAHCRKCRPHRKVPTYENQFYISCLMEGR